MHLYCTYNVFFMERFMGDLNWVCSCSWIWIVLPLQNEALLSVNSNSVTWWENFCHLKCQLVPTTAGKKEVIKMFS